MDGLDLGGYLRLGLNRRAVERGLETVSEASRKVPDSLKELHPEVLWIEMRGIGHILRPEYGSVDDKIIWRIATEFLVDLKPMIKDLLKRIDA